MGQTETEIDARGGEGEAEQYTLRVRRFKPDSGDGPYWQEFDVELDPTLSVLDGLLQAKDRDDEGIKHALETVKRLKEEAESAYIDDRGSVFNQDVLGAIELDYMLDCAETTIVSAIHRKESRGAQFRLDYPERADEEWLKHINVTRGEDGEPEISYSPVTITKWQPEVRKY